MKRASIPVCLFLTLLVAGGCSERQGVLDVSATTKSGHGLSLDMEPVTKVDICHRTEGRTPFLLISVASKAVDTHLAHGDGLVGEEVPSEPGMVFDAACNPTPSRHVITVTGSWNGTSYSFAGLFTVAMTGPVDAIATVSGYDGPLRLVLLGFNPEGPAGNTCNTQWLPTPLPRGPTMNPPTITAHWDAVPPATYCLNVVTPFVPPYPPPYNWTATITYP